MAAYLEATQLAGFTESEGRRYFGRYARLPAIELTPVPAYSVKAQFIKRFDELARFIR
jgi:hypothetical protein